ncbi:hypothetical protein BDB00DRAFT_800089 [Zychaea mexicana]|uniref:uncharacterized protein n=1 Tax=Zychaea mexicana TaxID=64656 RepID=UPI0022FEBA05|nr:uncharacterized protein BDB00DRAFT_800089 [Zychaea mexicana]KAI9498382.1 hypothetical protein BDB00DRAFT_800089 [Zychaea mexicana]
MSGSFSYTAQVQGWLMKQRHGICKSWLRRFFVLDGNELRYYKNEMDSIPQCVINLENYQVVIDVIPIALPLILKKQPQRQYTFLLLSNDKQKTERSDLFLQAETKEELDIWVNALQLHQMNDSTSVLDKWLERLDDMHSTTPPQAPHSASASTSASSAFLSPTKQQRHNNHHQHHQTRPPLRGHRSSESLASSVSSAGSHSTVTTSHRSSFAELRRTSNPSTLSSATSSPSTAKDNKFFANLFHHWPRSKSPARGASPSPPPPSRDGFYDDRQQEQQEEHQQGSSEAVVIAPALPIIHPSEYNKMYEEDDDETSSNNDATPMTTSSSSSESLSSNNNSNNSNDTNSNDMKKAKRQSLASRRNIQVEPITNPNRLSRGRSCSSLVMSDSSTDSIVDRFPRVLTTPTLGASRVNGASLDQPAN